MLVILWIVYLKILYYAYPKSGIETGQHKYYIIWVFLSYTWKTNEKAKWLSEEALQIAVKRREVKSKGEKERYKHLNAEFQSIARKDKKAFLRDQWKEIEENNRMGKTRDLFKKIRDTNGTFHAKMGSIKDRNGMDLTGSSRY